MAVVIYCMPMNKDATLSVMGSSGGCGIDLVAHCMQNILKDNAEAFREYGIMVPVDDNDPILKGRDLYDFLFNDWVELFEMGGYIVMS